METDCGSTATVDFLQSPDAGWSRHHACQKGGYDRRRLVMVLDAKASHSDYLICCYIRI